MIDSTPFFTERETHSLQEWRKRYEDLGMVTIPLLGKRPHDMDSWKATPSQEQWLRAGSHFQGNIGIVMGNGYAVIDADNYETATLIDHGLNSIGYAAPTVSTPHGKHYYVRVGNWPETFNWSKLLSGVYAGELRARNSYVVAPGSHINGIPYRWEKGKPEDLMLQRAVEWEELQWLLPDQQIVTPVDRLPVRLLYRDMPNPAKKLLEQLAHARKGQAVEKYPSRSEAEAAVIAMLILAGWSCDEIFTAFQQYAPGKFRESIGNDQDRYFVRSYYRILSKIAAHPTRQEIAKLWQAVNTSPSWPGRNGFLQRDTYLGILAFGWQFATWTASASERDLAEYVSASQPGIHNALAALSNQGFIVKLSSNRFLGYGTTWKITPVDNVSSLIMINDDDSTEVTSDINELWSQSKLGRTAGTVYRLLSSEPISVRRLSQLTSKARSTITLALGKHLGTCNLAKKVPDGWIRGPALLARVAEDFETKKAQDARRSSHKRQREAFAEFRVKRKTQRVNRRK